MTDRARMRDVADAAHHDGGARACRWLRRRGHGDGVGGDPAGEFFSVEFGHGVSSDVFVRGTCDVSHSLSPMLLAHSSTPAVPTLPWRGRVASEASGVG